jgi:hypothetical protein
MPKDPVLEAWNAIVGPFILAALFVGGLIVTGIAIAAVSATWPKYYTAEWC